MKKLLLLFTLVFMLSCGENKKPTVPGEEVAGKANMKPEIEKKAKKEGKEKIDCDFNQKVFSKNKRVEGEMIGGTRFSRGKKKNVTVEPLPPVVDPAKPVASGGTLYLEFYGPTLITGTMWNVYGDYTVQHSGLTDSQITVVFNKFVQYYEPFNVAITTDKRVFDRTPAGKRAMIIFTESWEWYCQPNPCAGGVAFLNAFKNATQTNPAFVFTSALAYSLHKITEAGAHEAGHTLGLRHQVVCNGTTIIDPYNPGNGVTAPIMGNSYNVVAGDFRTGPCQAACAIQNDVQVITNAVGLKIATGPTGGVAFLYVKKS